MERYFAREKESTEKFGSQEKSDFETELQALNTFQKTRSWSAIRSSLEEKLKSRHGSDMDRINQFEDNLSKAERIFEESLGRTKGDK